MWGPAQGDSLMWSLSPCRTGCMNGESYPQDFLLVSCHGLGSNLLSIIICLVLLYDLERRIWSGLGGEMSTSEVYPRGFQYQLGLSTGKTVLHFCTLNKVELKILYSKLGVFLFLMMIKMRFALNFNLAFASVCTSRVMERRLCWNMPEMWARVGGTALHLSTFSWCLVVSPGGHVKRACARVVSPL